MKEYEIVLTISHDDIPIGEVLAAIIGVTNARASYAEATAWDVTGREPVKVASKIGEQFQRRER